MYLNDDALNPASAVVNSFYRLINQDDGSLSLPSGVEYRLADDQLVLTFAGGIPDGNYKLEVGESSETNDVLSTAVTIGSIGDGLDLPKTLVLWDRLQQAAAAHGCDTCLTQHFCQICLRDLLPAGDGWRLDCDEPMRAGLWRRIRFCIALMMAGHRLQQIRDPWL